MRKVNLCLSLLLVFSIPWEDAVAFPGMGTLVKLVGVALLTSWLATVVITGRCRRPGPAHVAAALFVFWNGLSTFWSGDVHQTVARVFTYAQLLALLFILWDVFTTRARLLAALQAYILGAYVAIASTLYNFVVGSTSYYERFAAAGANPGDLGAVLALGVPVAFYLAVSQKGTMMGRLLVWVNYLFVPAALLGIALSGTRMAVVALIPGILFGITTLARLRLRARIAAFVLLVSATVLLVPFVPAASFGRLGTLPAEFTSGDLNGRLGIWRDGLAAFREQPLIGVGSNMFRSANSVGKVAHNSFLSVMVEVGLIGFTLFAVMFGAVIIQASDLPRRDTHLWLTILMAWGLAASSLTWEYRKPTWLFLSLAVVAAGTVVRRKGSLAEPLGTAGDVTLWSPRTGLSGTALASAEESQ